MEVVAKKHVILVHDVMTGPFPDPTGLSKVILKYFEDKAVSFLPGKQQSILTDIVDYASAAASTILSRIQIHQNELKLSTLGRRDLVRSTLHVHLLEPVKLAEYYANSKFYACDSCHNKIEITPELMAYHCDDCEYDLCEDCFANSQLTYDTRAFISHKRTTGQGSY